MKSLSGLYVITDPHLMPENSFASKAEAALDAGASIIQYRDKSTDRGRRTQQAEHLKKLSEQYQATLIINDDITLALETDADGVHIGSDDDTLQQARQQLGKEKIIGVSCYNQLALARTAIDEGADYIAFGSFFLSNVKPDAPRAGAELISSIKQQSAVPVCCIGGIDDTNAAPLIEAGADMLAVISHIFAHSSHQEISRACQRMNQLFTS